MPGIMADPAARGYTGGMPLPADAATILLLHNPRCSKSRAVKEILETGGVEFVCRHYLDDPLSRDELEDLARRLSRPPREWLRTGEPAYGEAGLSADADAGRILEAMVAHPILMERPIVVRGERALVGRPPECVGELLDP
jgi:arsenate reductase